MHTQKIIVPVGHTEVNQGCLKPERLLTGSAAQGTARAIPKTKGIKMVAPE